MRAMGFRPDTEKTTPHHTAQSILLPCDFRHALCTGMTGSGKTASLILPAMQDRIQKGYSILAYTYKGHEHAKIKHLAQKANRLQDVIEIGKPHGSYINLLSMFSLKVVQNVLERLISGNHPEKDNYWTLSAARLGANITEVLRHIHHIDKLVTAEFGDTVQFRTVIQTEDDLEGDTRKSIKYTYPNKEPSFKTLAEVSKSPKSLKRFYSGLDLLTKNIRTVLNKKRKHPGERTGSLPLFTEERNKEYSDKRFVQKITVALLRLEKSIAAYKDFTIDKDSSDGTGNNGVLQVLNNGVLGLAGKDYINSTDIDLVNSLGEGSIVIVDIEGIETQIHGILLDSVLERLSLRIRSGSPHPVSVFVDEANRVLSPDMDIHNDTLRESRVELIVAAQNEEQMITKFGEIQWSSLRQNFGHIYHIDSDHMLSYNHEPAQKAKALIIGEEDTLRAEYFYNSLPSSRQIFEKNFLYDGELPQWFTVEYDPLVFEKNLCLHIRDTDSKQKEMEYTGREMKKRLESVISGLGYSTGSTNEPKTVR